ncbi:DUF4347 domain-containing protein, partial [Neptunomonas sp.]|uniref:DUF4347 domain-containing protein n=1 Tax=Neptunomonas sp. TaxID=1971898 RepID=UPI0025F2B835
MGNADRIWKKKTMAVSYLLEPLEPRIMLSADPFGAAETAVDLLITDPKIYEYEALPFLQVPTETAFSELDIDSVTALFSQDSSATAAGLSSGYSDLQLQPLDGELIGPLFNEDVSVQLVIVDAGVSNQEQLLSQIIPHSSSVSYQVHYLDANSDGLQQVTDVLNQYDQVDALHLISHGTSQGVQLGNTFIDNESLIEKAELVSTWTNNFAKNADVLLYGCDVSATDAGNSFAQTLQHLTGADVAASDDKTGASSLGGDWQLESHFGEIETVTLTDVSVQQWLSTLALPSAGFLFATDDVSSPSGANGLDSWLGSDLVSLADPGLTLGATSNGTLGLFQNLSTLAQDGTLNIDGFHFVMSNISLGSGAASIDLLQGDLLFSTDQNETMGGVSIAESDVVLFRPTTPGDYSTGTTQILIDDLTTTGTDLEDFALVEAPMLVAGGASLDIGDIIYNAGSVLFDQNIYSVSISAVGEGTTVKGAPNTLVDGNSISVTGAIGAIELVNYTHTVGGENLTQGELLVSFESDQTNVGNTPVPSVSKNDIVTLSGPNSTNIEVNVVFEGSDIGLDSQAEALQAMALIPDDFSPVIANNSLDVDQGEVVTLSSSDLLASDIDSADGLLTFNVSDVQNGHFALASDTASSINSFTQDKIGTNEIVFVHEGGELASSYKVAVSDGVHSSVPSSAAISFSSTPTGTLWLGIRGDEGTSNGIPGLNGSSISKGDILQQRDPNFAMGAGTTDGTFSTAFDMSLFSSQDETVGFHYISSNITVGGTNSVSLQAGDVLLSSKNSMTLNSNGASPPGSVTMERGDIYYFRPDSVGDYTTGNFYLLVDDLLGSNTEVRAISLVERDVLVGDYTLQAGDLLFSRAGGSEDNDIRFLRTSGIDLSVSGDFPGETHKLIEGDNAGIDLDRQVFGLDVLESDLTIGGQSHSAGTLLISLKDDDSDLGNTSVSVTRNDVIALDVTQTTLGSGSTQAQASILFDGSDVGFGSGNETLDGFSLSFDHAAANVAPVITTNNFTLSEDVTTTITSGMLAGTDVDDVDSGLVFNISLVTGGQFELASNLGVAVTSFTQNQIALADVVFVDNGDETA